MSAKTNPLTIVALFDGEPLAASDALAAGVRHSHESVIKLVRKHQPSLERFGPLRFEIRKGAPLPRAASPRPRSSRCSTSSRLRS